MLSQKKFPLEIRQIFSFCFGIFINLCIVPSIVMNNCIFLGLNIISFFLLNISICTAVWMWLGCYSWCTSPLVASCLQSKGTVTTFPFMAAYSCWPGNYFIGYTTIILIENLHLKHPILICFVFVKSVLFTKPISQLYRIVCMYGYAIIGNITNIQTLMPIHIMQTVVSSLAM